MPVRNHKLFIDRVPRYQVMAFQILWPTKAPQPPTIELIVRPLAPAASAPMPIEVPATAPRKTHAFFEMPERRLPHY